MASVKNKKSEKFNLNEQVAFILGTYEGGTLEQNLPLAKYIVSHVKRHLTKRSLDGRKRGAKSKSLNGKGGSKAARQ